MLIGLDRVIVAVDDLAAAVEDYSGLFGFGPEPSRAGGELPATACFRLGNTTIELALRAGRSDPGSSGLRPGLARPSAPGVAALLFREDDPGDEPAQTDDREGGEDGEHGARGWLEASETRGLPIRLTRAREPAASPPEHREAAADQVSGLDHVVISTADLEAARRLYGERLGLRLALDRSFEQRGIRILFFRIAGVTIEVVGRLPGVAASEASSAGEGEAETTGHDRFGGLAFQAGDLRAIRARLAARGFDVSEDRKGHKPGTRVCTLRSGTHGVPTLLIGPDLG